MTASYNLLLIEKVLVVIAVIGAMADVVVSLVVVVAVVSISSTLLKLFMNADTPPYTFLTLSHSILFARPLTVKTPDSCQDGALQLFISLPEFRFTRSKGASF